MTMSQPPLLALLLTRLLADDDEPLVGDLIEAHVDRSHGWFWRQVVFAVLLRTLRRVGRPIHFAAIDGPLVSIAMLVVLSVQVVVAASLLDRVFQRVSFAWVAEASLQAHWRGSFSALAFLAALVVGRAAARVHLRSRLIVVLVCGAGATLIAFFVLHLSNPTPMRPFLPSAMVQLGVAVVFIVGLFAGFTSKLVYDQPT